MFQVNPHDFPQLAPDFNGSMPRFCRRSFDPLYVGNYMLVVWIYIYISLGEALSWYFLGIYWQNHDIIESKIFSHSVEKPTIAKPSNIVKNYILWSLKHIESKNFSEPWTEKCWILIERSGSNQCPRQCAWTFPSTKPKTY